MKQRFLLLSRYAIFAAALPVFLAGQSALASTVVVGTCKSGLTSFSTVQAAVNAAPNGSTIDVCPGTYPEQVTINAKSLTIIGVLSGTSEAAVLIPPSGGLTVNASDFGGKPVAAQLSLRMPLRSPFPMSRWTVRGMRSEERRVGKE